jgi:hypothetical protein
MRDYTERKAEVDSFVRAMATIWAEMPADTRTREPKGDWTDEPGVDVIGSYFGSSRRTVTFEPRGI